MANEFEFPQMFVSEVPKSDMFGNSGRDDETDIQSVGKEFPLNVIG